MTNGNSLPPADFAPTASWAMLKRRADLLARSREFFDVRGFTEVETPLLSADTVIDRHIDPIAVTLPGGPCPSSPGKTYWLQTSPEFCMKRLLAAGADAIYQITRAFRAGECGPLHNIEFTILEWYRVGDSYEDGMRLLAEFASALIGCPAPNRVSYRDAYLQYAGVEPHAAELPELREAASRRGIDVPEALAADREALLDLLLLHCVQPQLGRPQPTILFDYPGRQSALARIRDECPPVAERFELYAEGLELANGYHELLDVNQLRQRNKRVNQLRREDGKPELPEESRLIAAMDRGLPPCCGVALGLDRLLMLIAGATRIDQVIAFPIARA